MFRPASTILLLALLASPVAAQSPMPDGYDPARAQLDRAQLQQLLQSYQEGSQSQAYSAAYRQRTRAQTDMIRERLENGDLQVGDKVQMTVEGQTALTGTFTVETGRVLVLPQIGAVPLAGVLRSELEPHLTKQIGKYIIEPVVHAQSLVRITVTGDVGKAGFYVVPAQALIPDVLMTAGGPGGTADLGKLKISRAGHTIWDSGTLQKAILEGWTLDQLSLRAGDEIEVPAKKGGNFFGNARLVIVSLAPIIFLLRVLKII